MPQKRKAKRKRVNPIDPPYTSIGVLTPDFGRKDFASGTGTIIHPNWVLTAAHCLYEGIGQWAQEVWFTPAVNGGEMPYKSMPSEEYYITTDFLHNPDSRVSAGYDVGLVYFPENFYHVPEPYRWQPTYIDAQTLNNALVRITGYPGDRPFRAEKYTMWTARSQIKVDGDELHIDHNNQIVASKGQSGSAFQFVKRAHNCEIVGVFSGEGRSGSDRILRGAYLTQDLVNKINLLIHSWHPHNTEQNFWTRNCLN